MEVEEEEQVEVEEEEVVGGSLPPACLAGEDIAGQSVVPHLNSGTGELTMTKLNG